MRTVQINIPDSVDMTDYDFSMMVAAKLYEDKKNIEFFETQVDLGEASAIALAKEHEDVLLLFDDLKTRKLAYRLNLKITGALA